jgi:hypothetical protein
VELAAGSAYDPAMADKQLEELDALLPHLQTPVHQEKFQRVQVSLGASRRSRASLLSCAHHVGWMEGPRVVGHSGSILKRGGHVMS